MVALQQGFERGTVTALGANDQRPVVASPVGPAPSPGRQGDRGVGRGDDETRLRGDAEG